MVCPCILAGVKKEYALTGLWVNGRQVCPLVAIAVVAREGEILWGCLTSMLFGDEVVRFVRDAYVVFVNPAVFTAAAGAASNITSKSG